MGTASVNLTFTDGLNPNSFEADEVSVLENGTLELKNGEDRSYVAHGAWSAVDVLRGDKSDFIEEIADFMSAGGQQVPDEPMERVAYKTLSYLVRVDEEVDETFAAWEKDDTAEAVDGFLDTAYVAFTGALQLAGVEATREGWEAILRANTSKIDGTYGETVTDPGSGKILKPEGWQAPDIEGILARHSR